VNAAEAALKAAKAQRDAAALDLQRTRISSPFGGRVRSTQVNVGQFVPAGTVVASVYDSAAVEVRLALSNEQLALSGLSPGGESLSTVPINIQLSAIIGGERYEWPARLTRMEASIDKTTRFYTAVAEVERPFDNKVYPQPLVVGLFVEARIPGKTFDKVLRLPVKAVVNAQLLGVDSQQQLAAVPVQIVDRNDTYIWVQAPVDAGQMIVVSDPRVLQPGLRVRTQPFLAKSQ
jgi:RND family efflux transporter MFP subunit